MKKYFPFSVIVLSTLLLFSCAAETGNNPKATLQAFFEALSKKDVTAARKFATADSKSMLDMMEMGLKMNQSAAIAKELDQMKMQYGEAAIVGDQATVAVKINSSESPTNFILKKENGAWKVAFDSGSMMQMGINKRDHLNENDIGKMKEEMEALKKINTDSLQDILKNSLKALDSLKAIAPKQ